MKHQATKVTGGCLCGRVRYEAHVFLDNGYICHCTICRRCTGQPAELTVLIKAGTLRYLKDEPKYYVSSPTGSGASAVISDHDWSGKRCAPSTTG